MTNNTSVDKSTQAEKVSIKISAPIHREVKIESAHTGVEIAQLLDSAWQAYKLANPKPWRPETKKGKAA